MVALAAVYNFINKYSQTADTEDFLVPEAAEEVYKGYSKLSNKEILDYYLSVANAIWEDYQVYLGK